MLPGEEYNNKMSDALSERLKPIMEEFGCEAFAIAGYVVNPVDPKKHGRVVMVNCNDSIVYRDALGPVINCALIWSGAMNQRPNENSPQD